jgi:putative alpha-1,2-mannosidase
LLNKIGIARQRRITNERIGNVFAGATLPYGMAKAVADVDSDSNQGGFSLDGGKVTGFSMMHDSGTGGSPSLGNFPLWPYSSCTGDDIDNCVFPKTTRKVPYVDGSPKASPGYFGIQLTNGVQASMTAAKHTALFRFSFSSNNAGGTFPLIFLDLTDLSDSRQNNASITVQSDSGRMVGNARFNPSFGSGTYILYFCADFSGPKLHDNGVFVDSRASSSVKEIPEISRGINSRPLPAGAFVRFESSSSPILARVATSFISSDQACAHAEAEIPSWDFDGVRTAAESAWRTKLSPVKVNTTGVDSSLTTNLYSGIYRTMV